MVCQINNRFLIGSLEGEWKKLYEMKLQLNSSSKIYVIDGPMVLVVENNHIVVISPQDQTQPDAEQSNTYHFFSITTNASIENILFVGNMGDQSGENNIMICSSLKSQTQIVHLRKKQVSAYLDFPQHQLNEFVLLMPLFLDFISGMIRKPTGFAVTTNSNKLMYFRFGLMQSEIQLAAKPVKL